MEIFSLKKGQMVSVLLPSRSDRHPSGSEKDRSFVWTWMPAEVLEIRSGSIKAVVVDPTTCARVQMIELAIDEGYLRTRISIDCFPY
ncbi:MAG: hypothetical protein KBD19_03315 [Candidatus Moranbacteria bacterium]|nr:hypothetical protein [Candidatus Moranbacteria bacterium]